MSDNRNEDKVMKKTTVFLVLFADTVLCVLQAWLHVAIPTPDEAPLLLFLFHGQGSWGSEGFVIDSMGQLVRDAHRVPGSTWL